MTRVNIYSQPVEHGDETTLLGWFDIDRAARFDDGVDFDGNSNRVGVISRSQWTREFLFLTAGGRWIHNVDRTRDHNGPDLYEFYTPEQAWTWLVSSGNDDAVTEHFGPLAEESGPGRPEIGPAFSVRFPPELLAQIDDAARECGLARAAWLRIAAERVLRQSVSA